MTALDRDEDGRPLTVTVRADRVGNDETILVDLARFLMQRIRERVLEYYPRLGRRALPYVRGLLTVTNHNTLATRAAPRGAPSRNFADLKIADMNALLMLLGESDERVDQLNLEWSFQIAWPDDLTALVGAKVKPPPWFFDNKKSPWLRLWNTPDRLSCLAYTLVHLMDKDVKNLFDTKTRNGLQTAERRTVSLMEKMEWNKYVNIYEGCAKFVEEYDQFEVVILTSMSLKTRARRVYTGSRFVPKILANGKYVKCPKRLYLFHDIQNNHVVGTITVPTLCARMFTEHWHWCFKCHYCYNSPHVTHNCDGEDVADKERKTKICPKCNETMIVGQHSNCPMVECSTCKGYYAKYVRGVENEQHRCMLFKAPFKEKDQVWNTELEPKGKVEAALAYDFETFIKRIPSSRANIAEFNYDEDGRLLKGNTGFVKQTIMEYDTHVVNWISCTDMNTRVTKVFRYDECNMLDDPLKRFVNYVTRDYNKGFNTLVAHNAKSYDALLLAAYLYNNIKEKNVTMVRRGRKILQITVATSGNQHTTKFIDSLTHCPGSLASLYKAFCGGALTKGYYPYAFNIPENYGYIGVLPAKKYYGVFERAKNREEINKFESWWEAERVRVGETWNYSDESLKYSVEDTEGLATIMKIYDDICVKNFKLSPWKFMTGPSFRHAISLELVTKMLFDKYQNETGVDLFELGKSDPTRYATIITQLAASETWCVLRPFEYAPVRQAMRGGRTECFKMFADLTQEEMDAGVRYRHV